MDKRKLLHMIARMKKGVNLADSEQMHMQPAQAFETAKEDVEIHVPQQAPRPLSDDEEVRKNALKRLQKY